MCVLSDRMSLTINSPRMSFSTSSREISVIIPLGSSSVSLEGYTLEGYTIVSILGKGAAKEVYRAQGTRTPENEVAVLMHSLKNEHDNEQIERELRFLDQCGKIDGVMHLVGRPQFIEEAGGRRSVVLVADLCDQGVLNSWGCKKTLRERLQMILQTAETVKRLHDKGLMHGDLKPDNIGVATTPLGNRSMILDLGSMRSRGESTGMRSMTPAYYPPGMPSEEGIPYAQDVFALGVILYEMVQQDTPRQGALFEDIARLCHRERNFCVYLFNTKQTEITAVIEFLDVIPEIKQLLHRMLVLDDRKRCSIERVIYLLKIILIRGPVGALNELAEPIQEPGTPLLKDVSKPSF